MGSSYLITGTTSGIGNKLSKLITDKGHKLITVNRKDTKNQISKQNYNIDISNFEEVFNLINELNISGNLPDYIILNAGVNIFDNKNFLSIEDFKKCFDINFYGSMNFVSSVEKLSLKNICFVFISSTSNIIPNPAALGYFSSKYLLDKISNYLSKNNSYKVVILGPVQTNISRNIGQPKGIAKIIYNILAIDDDKASNKIFDFTKNKKKKLYFTKKSIVIYYIIKILLILVPNLYKGGKN